MAANPGVVEKIAVPELSEQVLGRLARQVALGVGAFDLRLRSSNGAYRVTALEQAKLMPQWLALLFVLGGLLLPTLTTTYAIIAERERRSLELLISLPVSVAEVLAAKILAVLIVTGLVRSVRPATRRAPTPRTGATSSAPGPGGRNNR